MNAIKTLFIFLSLSTMGVSAQDIPVLVDAKFNQDAPYNNSCPDGTVTGCGPTAVAEILTRYKMPAHGFGIAPLVFDEDTITVDMNAIEFDWNNILDEYKDDEYSESQAKAIADLMYACGVAMNVSYGYSTSVTNYAKMLYGLQHYLHISPESRYLHRKNFSTSELIEILNGQLRSGYPVFYRGTWFYSGSRADHMFVVDGLDADGLYHVNFGHGGVNDKYCDINVINQSGSFPGNRGVCYNASQAMTINLFPTPDFMDYPMQASVSEEPIILNGDVYIESAQIPLSDSFTLSCRLRNCCSEKVTVTYGWALTKDDDVLDIFGKGSYGLSPGYTFKEAKHCRIKLPAYLDNGEYKLVMYSKSSLEDDWRPVWRDAATEVEVIVKNGVATVTVPPNHMLDPELFLSEDIQEVENEFASSVPGRAFSLSISNQTLNNFENNIRLEIIADGDSYTYVQKVPVYSQTNTVYHILVPDIQCNLKDKTIDDVKASYYYDLEEAYQDMPVRNAQEGVEGITTAAQSRDISVYDLSGRLVGQMKSEDIASGYMSLLQSLPAGIYMIKEANKTRKVIITK